MSPAFQHKMEFAGSLIIFLILAALIAGLYFSFASKVRPLHYDDPPFLRSRSNRGDAVIVAREAADVDKPMAAMAAGKQAEFWEMIRGERFSLYATAQDHRS